MQTAKGTLALNEYADVQVSGVTPGEAVILQGMFRNKKGGLKNLVLTEDIPDEGVAETLRVKYATKKKFTEAFPGDVPKLPKTFAELPKDLGITVAVPAKPKAPEPAK